MVGIKYWISERRGFILAVQKTYGDLGKYIGLQRCIILQEFAGEMNISMSSNGGFHLFLTPRTGFTYGFGFKALKAATADFEFLQDKNTGERKQFVRNSQIEKLDKELASW